MLQSIQFNGSGGPTYVYSEKEADTTADFYHVFATETRGYSRRREPENMSFHMLLKKKEGEIAEQEALNVLDRNKTESLQEVYEREYGRRESFLWKQR